MNSLVLKVLAPAAGIAAVLIVTRVRGISWRDGLGLRAPRWGVAAIFLVAWLAWIGAAELVIRHFGLDQAKPWPPYPPLTIALRILAIGILGPIAEELAFRGVFYERLARTRVGVVGAIALPALAWALIHVSYGPGTLAMIALDGLILGAARWKSGSLYVPMAMHIVGNLISIAQSLSLL